MRKRLYDLDEQREQLLLLALYRFAIDEAQEEAGVRRQFTREGDSSMPKPTREFLSNLLGVNELRLLELLEKVPGALHARGYVADLATLTALRTLPTQLLAEHYRDAQAANKSTEALTTNNSEAIGHAKRLLLEALVARAETNNNGRRRMAHVCVCAWVYAQNFC